MKNTKFITLTIFMLIVGRVNTFAQAYLSNLEKNEQDIFSFSPNISYEKKLKKIVIEENHDWIEKIKGFTKHGDIHLTVYYAKNDSGYYTAHLKHLLKKGTETISIEPEDFYEKNSKDSLTIIIANDIEGNNFKRINGDIIFSLSLDYFEFKPASGKALGFIPVEIPCLENPPEKFTKWIKWYDWGITLGGLAGGGYLYFNGQETVNEALTEYENEYRTLNLTKGREEGSGILKGFKKKNNRGVNKQIWGIAIVSADALWTTIRMSVLRKKYNCYHSNYCQEQRKLWSFQPIIESGSELNQNLMIGVGLQYKFK